MNPVHSHSLNAADTCVSRRVHIHRYLLENKATESYWAILKISMTHEKSNLIGCVSFVNTYSLLILLDCGYSVVSGVLVVFILIDYEYSLKASAGERARKLSFTACSLIPQQEAIDQTITCTVTGVAHSVIIIWSYFRNTTFLPKLNHPSEWPHCYLCDDRMNCFICWYGEDLRLYREF